MRAGARRAGAAALGGLAIALVALVAPAAPTAAPPTTTTTTGSSPDGFDHLSHAGELLASGAAATGCTACHAIDRRGRVTGRPGHHTCFGACHGEPPRVRSAADRRRRVAVPVGERREVCQACHAAAALTRVEAGSAERLAVDADPYLRDPEYALTLSHAAHAGVTRGCRACHATPDRPGGPSPPAQGSAARDHASCATCHLSGKVRMTDCERCHTPAVGPTRRPSIVAGDAPVGARLDHRRHAARGARCETCHLAVATTTSDRIPAPAKATCAGCHDGEHAASMLVSCRTCHAAPRVPRPGSSVEPARFSHLAHPGATVCVGCHRGGGRARLGHATCTGAACHAADFADPTPTICGACHVAAEPWTEQHLDPPPTGPTEFGARFSHRAHLGGASPRIAWSCERCHDGQGDAVAARATDHASCRGDGCHDRGRTPTLTDCGGCHVARLVSRHAAERTARRFAVRGRFRHAAHRAATAGVTPSCSACHDVLLADGLDDLPGPAKARCAPCHDGERAFKMTGHGCIRCHERGAGADR
jgi:hypothetical protein